MKLFEFDKPPGAFPKPGTETFDDQAAWVQSMKEHGAEEFLNEKEFNLDLIYAVGNKGTRLKGTWSDERQLGVKYKGKKGQGLAFEKGYRAAKRSFKKANIGEAGIGKAMKKGAKWLKRGAQGFDGYETVDELKAKVQSMDDDRLLGQLEHQTHTKQQRFRHDLIKRELRRRGHRDFSKYMDEGQSEANLVKKYRKLIADHTDIVTQDGVPPSDLAADLLIDHKWLPRYFKTVGIVMKQKMKQQLAIDLS